MENKINIAELVKDCPHGMELDCILYDNIYFDTVGHNSIKCYIQNKGYRTSITFDIYGGLIDSIPTKCVIFPKGKTTWEGFVPPCKFKDGDIDNVARLWTIEDAKDGDVLFHSDSASNGIFIFKEILQRGTIQKVMCYCDYDSEDGFCLGENHTCCWTDSKILHPATEEQRDLLFQKMKEAGYKWNAETKTLEELIEPKFKVGDTIQNKETETRRTITKIHQDCYECDNIYVLIFENQDEWELVHNKFDITTLKPFDKVLMRSSNAREWDATLYSHYNNNKFYGCGMCCDQCIPYEQNKHLLGTTDDCDDYYKTWE